MTCTGSESRPPDDRTRRTSSCSTSNLHESPGCLGLDDGLPRCHPVILLRICTTRRGCTRGGANGKLTGDYLLCWLHNPIDLGLETRTAPLRIAPVRAIGSNSPVVPSMRDKRGNPPKCKIEPLTVSSQAGVEEELGMWVGPLLQLETSLAYRTISCL